MPNSFSIYQILIAFAALIATVSALWVGIRKTAREHASVVARLEATEVARTETQRHAEVCPWRAEAHHLTTEVSYIRGRVDAISDFLRNGKKIAESSHKEV